MRLNWIETRVRCARLLLGAGTPFSIRDRTEKASHRNFHRYIASCSSLTDQRPANNHKIRVSAWRAVKVKRLVDPKKTHCTTHTASTLSRPLREVRPAVPHPQVKCCIACFSRGAFDSAKNHKRQRRKRQSVTAKREKSQTP